MNRVKLQAKIFVDFICKIANQMVNQTEAIATRHKNDSLIDGSYNVKYK